MGKTPHGGTDELVTHPPFRGRQVVMISDEVTMVFQKYKAEGGELDARDWHDREAPAHRRCSLCLASTPIS